MIKMIHGWIEGKKAQPSVEKAIPVVNRVGASTWFFQGTTKDGKLGTGNSVDNPYEVHAWVRGAIESVAMNISQTPLLWKNSQDRQAAPRDSNKWEKIFESPNPDMGLAQLLEATLVYLLHYGECMWVLDRATKTSIPTEIYPYNGSLFDPILDEKDNVIGWEIEVVYSNGKKETLKFNRSEVLHFKLFNPYDPKRGLSPLAAAQLGIDQDYFANEYNKAFFINGALPNGVVEVEEQLSDEVFNRMRQQFLDHHQGVSKAHTLAILEGGAKYKQLTVSQKDMEFLNQKKWNRDEVLACFKVPKLELGIWDDVNFAVAKVQAREFWVKTLIPKMRLIEYVWWSQLFSLSGNGQIFAEFDTSKIEALQGDLNEKVEMMFKLWQMGYPANKLNERFGINLPNIPNGNASYVMNNVYQVDETGAIQFPTPPNNSEGNNSARDEEPDKPPTGAKKKKPKENNADSKTE